MVVKNLINPTELESTTKRFYAKSLFGYKIIYEMS